MLDVPDVRRRLRQTLDRAKRDAAAHRAQIDAAGRDYEQFLSATAEPVVRVFADAVRAEGFPLQIATPAGAVRLELGRSGEDFIELTLDTSGVPVVVGRVSRGRGSHVVALERPVREGAAVADLTSEDVLQFLLDVIGRFVER